MKRVIVFLALAVLTLRAGAQNTRVGNGTLNFSVPDAPAFAILGASPPSIIRPTATREVTAGIADLFRGGGVLPQNLFVEFSPWSVIGAKLTFDEYRESSFERFLYRLRLSLASRSTDQHTGASYSSWGLRMTFEDESDPRLDDSFVATIRGLIERDLSTIDPAKLRPPTSGTDSNWSASLSAEQRASLASSAVLLSKARMAQAEKSWNASIFEGGVACSYRNPDSLVKHVVIDRAALWLTKTFALSNWGQVLLGTAPCMMRSSMTGAMDSVNATLSSRFYGGTNSGKLFIEAQCGVTGRTGDKPSDSFDLTGGIRIGGEYNVTGPLWLEFDLSGTRDFKTATNTYVAPSIKVKWGSLPG